MTKGEMLDKYGIRMLRRDLDEEATPEFEKFCRGISEVFDNFDSLDDEDDDI